MIVEASVEQETATDLLITEIAAVNAYYLKQCSPRRSADAS